MTMRRLLLSIVIVGALGAASTPLWLGDSTPPATEIATVRYQADTYRRGLQQCLAIGKHDAALVCIDQVVTSLREVDVVDAARVTEETFAQNLVVQCHEGMHALGRVLSKAVLEDRDLALGERWEACGKGLLHGVFENIELDSTAAAEKVFEHCSRPEFLAYNPYQGNCLHSAGHSVYKAHDANLDAASKDCFFNVEKGSETDTWMNDACISGVYMSYLDERFRTSPTVPENVDWDTVLPNCKESPAPEICAANFDLAIRSGGPQARSQLQWCYEQAGTAWICLHKLSLGMGLNALTQGEARKSGTDYRICTDGVRGDPKWGANAPYVLRTCVAGFLKAAATHGISEDQFEATVCKMIPVDSCAEIIASDPLEKGAPPSE